MISFIMFHLMSVRIIKKDPVASNQIQCCQLDPGILG